MWKEGSTLVLHGRATEGDTKHKNLRALGLIAAFLAYVLWLLNILEPSNPFDFFCLTTVAPTGIIIYMLRSSHMYHMFIMRPFCLIIHTLRLIKGIWKLNSNSVERWYLLITAELPL